MADLIERLRKLEGELREGCWDQDADTCAKAAAALEAAREDGERLEHFVETGGQIVCRRDSYAFVDSHDGITDYFPTAREAIDQARGIVPEAGQEVGNG